MFNELYEALRNRQVRKLKIKIAGLEKQEKARNTCRETNSGDMRKLGRLREELKILEEM